MNPGKREWAEYVVREAGVDYLSKTGQALLAILMVQAEAPENPGIGDQGAVFVGIQGMIDGFRAVDDLKYLGLSTEEAMVGLAKMGDAAMRILDAEIERKKGT